jgi:hypothetical protein
VDERLATGKLRRSIDKRKVVVEFYLHLAATCTCAGV